MQNTNTTATALTVKEVAQALRVSERHVSRLISNRKLASVTLGRCRRVRPEALAEFLNTVETVAR